LAAHPFPPTTDEMLLIGSLTEREREVLDLLLSGVRSKDIATSLEISSKTVSTYRAQLMGKLKVGNIVDLVRLGIRTGLIELN